MYCNKCGNEISKSDNYCRVCGAKIDPTVEIEIVRHCLKEEIGDYKARDDRIEAFKTKPIANIEELINKVDEKVQTEVEKHHKVIKEDDAEFVGPKKKLKKTDKLTNLTSPTTEITEAVAKIENAQKVKTPLISKSENKSKVKQSEPSKAKTVKEKKSIKKLWKDFINEDDDEYSIFSGLSLNSEPNKVKEEKTILDNKKTEPTIEKKSEKKIEPTLEKNVEKPSMPIKNLNRLKSSISSFFQRLNNYLSEKKKKIVEKKVEKKKVTTSEKNKSAVAAPKKQEPSVNVHETISISKDKVNSAVKKSHEPDIYYEDILLENKIYDQPKVNKIENKVVESAKTKDSRFENSISSINEKVQPSLLKLLGMGSKGIISLTAIGVALTILPVILSAKSFTLTIAIFSILKLIFNFLEFYFPLEVATNHTSVKIDKDTKVVCALINWNFCQLFLLLAFFIIPKDATLSFNLLGALTPTLWATIILFFLSSALSVAILWKKIKGSNAISFVGWYAITFITIELLLKLFWIIINFFSSSIL